MIMYDGFMTIHSNVLCKNHWVPSEVALVKGIDFPIV